MAKAEFEGRRIADNYDLQTHLGKGAFGSVYLAHSGNGETVAVKLFEPIPPKDTQPVKDFNREVSRLRRLKHPHIIPFYDSGIDELSADKFHPFIVMHYADHGSLDSYVKKHSGRIPTEEAVTYLVQATEGVQHAHDSNIIHQDLKPDNLLLHKHPKSDHLDIFIADFGVAVTAYKYGARAAGTYPYNAPEKFDKNIVKQGDQYSTGVIAYELLAGIRPIQLDSNIDLHRDALKIAKQLGISFEKALWDLRERVWKQAHQLDIPPSFEQMLRRQGIPMDRVFEELEIVVRKAMEKQVGDRYSSIGEFGDALQHAYNDGKRKQAAAPSIFPGSGTLKNQNVVSIPPAPVVPPVPNASTLPPTYVDPNRRSTFQPLPTTPDVSASTSAGPSQVRPRSGTSPSESPPAAPRNPGVQPIPERPSDLADLVDLPVQSNKISRRNLLAGAAILGGIGVSCGMGGLVSVLSHSGETANPANHEPQTPDHKAPMTTAPSVVQRTPEQTLSATELLVASEQAAWRNLLGRDLEIPIPPSELLQTMKYANSVGLGQMEPHFIPDLSVSENDNYPGWKKKPGYEFWQYIPTGNFEGMDGARFSGRLESSLTKKWILVDPILSGIGQYSHTDLYNRELPRLANRLHVSQEQVRLPTALEYNVLGNTHYSNWDDSTQREWFHETSIFDEGGSYPQLHAFAKGGSMIDKTGGLAHVDLVGDVKNDYIGYRPMVVFS